MSTKQTDKSRRRAVERARASNAVAKGSLGAAETAKDISARHYSGTWSELAERYGQSISAWEDEPDTAVNQRP